MTMNTKTLAISLLLCSAMITMPVTADKCYALGLSSGSESAAFQAGALQGILQKLPADQVQYSAVSGISGGAVNAVILSSHAKGDEQAAVNKMKQFWIDAGNSTLYQNWWGGVIAGLFTAGGIYDSTPLKTFLAKELTDITIDRLLNLGIVDVLSGHYVDFTEQNITNGDNLINALYASFAFPGFFPPVEAFGSSWFDGAAVYDLDLFSAINNCLKTVPESDVVVDVLLTSSSNLTQVDANDYTSIGMLFRYLEISSYYSSMDGLLRAQFAFPNVTFRYVIAPTKTLPTSLYPLNLSGDQIQTVIDQGIADAVLAIEKGASSSIENHLHYYHMKKTNDKRIKSLDFQQFIEAKKNGKFEQLNLKTDPAYMKYQFLK